MCYVMGVSVYAEKCDILDTIDCCQVDGTISPMWDMLMGGA